MSQITNHIMMIQPVGFRYNEQTAVNNYYQQVIEGMTPARVQEHALQEFNGFVDKLRAKGVNVVVIPDTKDPDTPDSIFPNNWVSFHEDGRVFVYPMFAPNRRLERRNDLLETLRNQYQLNQFVDLTGWEEKGKFLEGTGSLVLDRPNKVAYAALSDRTMHEVIDEFEAQSAFTVVRFTAYQTVGEKRLPIYHTNVMMYVGEHFAVICLHSIDLPSERENVKEHLFRTGKEIIEITEKQVLNFAGNGLQVINKNREKLILMSTTAFQSLDKFQKDQLSKHGQIIHAPLNTIEQFGGGSARCMMAEVFLPPKEL